MPGLTDPASAILPQQPMPRAMFGFDPPPRDKKGNLLVMEGGGGVFECVSNPAWVDVGGDG